MHTILIALRIELNLRIMKKLILLLLFPFLLQSQNFPELDVCPMDKSHFSRQKEVATITYSRLQLK